MWLRAGWYAASASMVLVWAWRAWRGGGAFQGAAVRWHRLWGLDLAVVGLGFVGLEVVRQGVLGASAGKMGDPVSLAGLLVKQLGVVLLVGVVAARRFRGGLRGLGVWWRPGWRTAGRIVGLFVVATGVTFLVLEGTLEVSKWAGYDQIQRHMLLEELGTRPGTLMVVLILLTAVVGAPLEEELVFRGMLQSFLVSRLRGRRVTEAQADGQGQGEAKAELELAAAGEPWGGGWWEVSGEGARWGGIVITAAVWALFHGSWQHMPALFVLGVVLGIVYERWGNLAAVMGIHALFNLLPVVLTVAGSGTTGS